eukprot:UC4_evm4s1315
MLHHLMVLVMVAAPIDVRDLEFQAEILENRTKELEQNISNQKLGFASLRLMLEQGKNESLSQLQLLKQSLSYRKNKETNIRIPLSISLSTVQGVRAKARSCTFYYPWYGNPSHDGKWLHWNHQRIPHWNRETALRFPRNSHVPPEDLGSTYYPLLGPYSSSDPKVVSEHFKLMERAGIDVAVVSWYGRRRHDQSGEDLDKLFPMILGCAMTTTVRVAFHLEPYDEGRGDGTSKEIKIDIEHINRRYLSHPGCYKNSNGLALFFVYDSYRSQSEEWAKILSSNARRAPNSDGEFIGLVVEKKHMNDLLAAGFDGMYTYFAVDGMVWGSTWSNYKHISRFANANGMTFWPTVSPGYNDESVRPWNNQNTRNREAGRYYRRSLEAVKSSGAELIAITSWNEWHEGTQIEPAQSHKGYPHYERGITVKLAEDELDITLSSIAQSSMSINNITVYLNCHENYDAVMATDMIHMGTTDLKNMPYSVAFYRYYNGLL